MTQNIEKLNTVLNYVKATFVGKNDVVDLLGICLLARENAFLYGPPGTKVKENRIVCQTYEKKIIPIDFMVKN